MFRELQVMEGESADIRGERGLPCCSLDRRSFLKCAVATGAALGLAELAHPAAGIPAGAVSYTHLTLPTN